MTAKELHVVGCRRTGTNYLEVVLEDNFDVEVYAHEAGWKHGLLDPGTRADLDGFVLIAKDPYAWLPSMERFYGSNPPQRVWQWIERAYDADHHFRKTRGLLLENYFMKYAYWFETLADDAYHYVRYESLLGDFEASLDAIRDALDLAVVKDPYVDVDVRVGAARFDSERRLGGSFDPTYYTEDRYLDEYTPAERDRVADYVRENGFAPLMKRLGYEVDG